MTEGHPPDIEGVRIRPETPDVPVTWRLRRRVFLFHLVSDTELDQISSTSVFLALHLTFLGIGAGVVISFYLAARTPNLDASVAAQYWLYCRSGVFALAYFLIASAISIYTRTAQLRRIRQRGRR